MQTHHICASTLAMSSTQRPPSMRTRREARRRRVLGAVFAILCCVVALRAWAVPAVPLVSSAPANLRRALLQMPPSPPPPFNATQTLAIVVNDRTAIFLVIGGSLALSVLLFASFAPLLGCFPGLCPGASQFHGLVFGMGSVVTPVAPVLG